MIILFGFENKNKMFNLIVLSFVGRLLLSSELKLKLNLKNSDFVNSFNPLYNSLLKMDNPFPKEFSMVLNFNYNVSNQKYLLDYKLENIDNLEINLKTTIEKILKEIILDSDLISLLIEHILPLKNVIFIPAFRTLRSSEKGYQSQEITQMKETIGLLIEKSFDRIPISLPREDPFEIPNLALILNTIKRRKISSEYGSLLGPEYFKKFNSLLRIIFPNIQLSIMWNFSDQKTTGGYIEDDREMGNWIKLGHGTQELISLLFLLMLPRDGIYIIDEPENGLHPGLQSKLLYFIKHIILPDRTYNKQFFFASHSTSFIDFTGRCSHFVCKKDKEQFSIELLKKEKLQIIRNELGLKPSALLQANGIIWVEGVSGKPYVKMLFHCFGIDLDELDVSIIHFGGGSDITSEHYTIDLLESLNPNFCIIIDSEKDDINDELKPELIKKKEEYEERGHLFWIIEKYRNIEGIIPQEAINEYYEIKVELKQENLKQPFENLKTYIKRLKDPSVGILPIDNKNYKRTRDAPQICELIKSNLDYKSKILENPYLKGEMKKMMKEIEKWILETTSNDIENEIQKIKREVPLNQLEEFISSYNNSQDPDEKDYLIRTIYPYAEELNKVIYYHNNEGIGDENYASISGNVLKIIEPNWNPLTSVHWETLFKRENGPIFKFGGIKRDKRDKKYNKEKNDSV